MPRQTTAPTSAPTSALTSALISIALLLAGCDQLGIESASVVAAKRDSEGKAVGGACRHAGHAIEDCYAMNKKTDKAAVFGGWREMNDYMRENKLDAVAPQATAADAVQEANDKHDETAAEPERATKKKKS